MAETVGRSVLRELVGAAVRAPSSHNTQPWLFEAGAGRLQLYADRTRALPVNDPEDRELTISCGCALFNLRAAAAAAGFRTTVHAFPESGDPDLLATVEIAPVSEADDDTARLAAEIPRRRTYRKRFDDRDVPAEVVSALEAAAAGEGAALDVIQTDAGRSEVVRLVREGDAALWASPSWRRELALWMHPRRQGDGLSVPGLVLPLAQAVMRSFDMGHGVAAKDGQLAEGSPLLAVLASPGDTPDDWLATGQALERCLLTASACGLQASYLNQPVQVAPLRSQLAEMIAGVASPQALLRFGYPGEAVDAAPRRDVEAVLTTA